MCHSPQSTITYLESISRGLLISMEGGFTLHNQCEAHKEVPQQWVPLQSHPQTWHSDCRKCLIQLLYQSIWKRKCKHISEVILAKCLDCCIILYNHTKQIFSGVRTGDKEINFGQECFHRNHFCSLTSVSSYCWVFFSSSSFLVNWRVSLLQRVNLSVLSVGSNSGTALAPKLIVGIWLRPCHLSQAKTM